MKRFSMLIEALPSIPYVRTVFGLLILNTLIVQECHIQLCYV